MSYKRVAQLRTADDFRQHLAQLGIEIPLEETLDSSVFSQALEVHGRKIGNRFTILPMEGWDAGETGHVTDLVKRRWQRFGQSGAKLIWGGEAVAVRHDGRANPQQLIINAETLSGIAGLRESLIASHPDSTDDLYIGLQLTHSGRFARPNDKKRLEPKILYHHPLLDKKFHLEENYPLMTDGEIDALIEDFVKAAVLAQKAGFDFVDIKHCHGYLGHEFLSAIERDGRYGGSFENRSRFLSEIVAGIRRDAPGLEIGVRLSAFDWIPFQMGSEGKGEAAAWNGAYLYAFGGDGTGLGIDLSETNRFLDLLENQGIQLVCITAGSPYYNPHIQRPALFPPSDGYQPPEDPLVGVARQIAAVARLKQAHPKLIFVGSGYSYLQDWLPFVAQAVLKQNMADSIGLGRMVLSYPDLPRDVLAGNELQRKLICRTFSDCTTAPRNGLISGCYPLDDFYKKRPESDALAELKKRQKEVVK
jgi:2,4-dienoyl-CoA reductase-like NADH-dependent reductase (Old Yellow Enzyme family)